VLYACQVATEFLITVFPAVVADRTVTGMNRCGPSSESSRSRYDPSGQSSVPNVSDGSQWVRTVLVGASRTDRGCRCPVTVPDCHTSRARSPLYQPIRYALTVNEGAVVDT
jgi:hypothetical protein